MGEPSSLGIFRSAVGGVRSWAIPVRMGLAASLKPIMSNKIDRFHSSKLEGVLVRMTLIDGVWEMLEDIGGKMDGF